LARQQRLGRDLDPPSLVALEYGVVAGTTAQYPPGHPWPPERPGRREDPHVEHAVVRPRRREQDEAAGQQADVPDHHAPGLAAHGLAAVEANLEVSTCSSQPPDSGRGVSQPASRSLQPGRGRAHHSGVQSDARHCGKGGAIRDGQVDPPLMLPETDRKSGTERGRYAQRRRHQVRRPARHDGQRDLAASQGLRAGPDRAVAAYREH
jgi:hypothetical protein